MKRRASLSRWKPWCLGMLAVMGAFAADARAAEEPSGDSTITLGEIQVRPATGELPTSTVLSSVNVLGADMIENQNVIGLWQVFRQMPGVLITEYRQGTTSGKLSFRGFNGEGEINAVKLLIDGIPSNSNDGNMPYLDMIFPLETQSVELVKGTNDPRYGLHNIAGNATISTSIGGGTYLKSRGTYGSFNTREAQLDSGIELGSFTQNYMLAYQAMDGYRDHAFSEKYSLAGKWFYKPVKDLRVGLIARTYKQNADESGYLTLQEANTDPQQSAARNAYDGGNRQMNTASVHADWQATDKLFWSTKGYFNHLSDQRWVQFYAPPQQERLVNENHYGVISTLTYRPQVSYIHSLAVEGGLDAEWQVNKSQRYATDKRVRTRTTRDQSFGFDIYGAYLQAVTRITEDLKIVPAIRLDRVYGTYTNNLTGQPYAINKYGVITQPKISAVYTVAPGYNLYGNYGRTFQVGVGTAAYKVNQTANLEPSVNDGFEVGVKFNPTPWLDGRVAGWQQTASNEARRKLNDPDNSSENIGRTRRRGIDLEATFRPTDNGTVWLSYSYQESEILQPETGKESQAGNEIDHVPNHIFAGGVDYHVMPALRLSAWANAQSGYYLERDNTAGIFGGFFLLNLSAAYEITRNVSLDFQIRNITDEYYEYVWWDGSRSLHSPADGRAFYGAVNVKF